jgi:hypothetical protein
MVLIFKAFIEALNVSWIPKTDLEIESVYCKFPISLLALEADDAASVRPETNSPVTAFIIIYKFSTGLLYVIYHEG